MDKAKKPTPGKTILGFSFNRNPAELARWQRARDARPAKRQRRAINKPKG